MAKRRSLQRKHETAEAALKDSDLKKDYLRYRFTITYLL